MSTNTETMTAVYSLHRARVPRWCDMCGCFIPKGGEFWRSKGPRSARMNLTFCCVCHVTLGLPTDGWTEAPDGETVVTALRPSTPVIAGLR